MVQTASTPGTTANGSKLSFLVNTPLRDKLTSNQIASAFSVRLVTSVEIAQVVATAGWDALLIDLEHGVSALQRL